MRFIRDTIIEVRNGYEAQFYMLVTIVCNMNVVGQREGALKVINEQKKVLKKHKLQQGLLESFVLLTGS